MKGEMIFAGSVPGGVEHELVPYGCAKLRISMFADERKKDRGKNEK